MARKNQKNQKPRKVVIKSQKADITAVGRALRALGGAGGGYLGTMLGSTASGASIGHGLGAQLSRWLGQGDYSVSANTILKQSAAGHVPDMHKNGQSITVRHREFVTEVVGSSVYTVQKRLPINPGISTTFPWLSGIASQYSEYRVKGMVYHFVPTSGTAVGSTSTALGSVMLQTSYRANEAAPAGKVELLNEYWSSEAMPCEEFCHPIECDPKENPFNVQYIRTADVPSTDNILLYDLGTTTVATSGQQAVGTVLGDLWISYEIELRKPKLTDATGESTFVYKANSTLANGSLFGSALSVANNTYPVVLTPASSTLTIGAGLSGTHILIMEMVSSATTYTPVPPTSTTNCTVTTLNCGSGAGVCQNLTMAYVFKVTDPTIAAAFTLGGGGGYSTAGGTESIRISPCNPLLL